MSDEAPVRTYYDRPIVKEPAWTWEVPWYLFAGGLSGMSSVVAGAARAAGEPELAQAARRLAAGGAAISPLLLISDLGRPGRFYNMLRVFRPTSPMSMGSWLLAVYGPAAVGAAVLAERQRTPRVEAAATAAASVLGPPLAAYTAVLLGGTAIPVWAEARRELPFVFVASGLAASGAAASLLVDHPAARRLVVAGTALERGASVVMERRLGPLADPYHRGAPGWFSRASKGLSVAGALGNLVPFRRIRLLGAAMVVAGGVCERHAVFHAGFASARDPEALIRFQRAQESRPAAAKGPWRRWIRPRAKQPITR